MRRTAKLLGMLLVPLMATAAFPQGVWVVQDSLPSRLRNLFFLDQDHGWIVTENDTVLRTTDGGLHWDVLSSGVHYALNDVYFVNQDTGWAVGDLGTMLRTADGGKTWEKVETGVSDLILRIQFIDHTNGWAIGKNGLIMRTTDGGSTWSATTFPADSAELKDVMFVDKKHGWAVGSLDEASLIIRTTDGGESWETVWHDTLVCNFTCVFFVDSLIGYVGGMKSVIQKTTDGGVTWEIQHINPEEEVGSAEEDSGDGGPSHIRDLFFLNQNLGFAAGHKDSMLCTTDGGQTWKMIPVEANRPVISIWFVDEEHGWAITSAGGSGIGGEKGEGGNKPKTKMAYILTFQPAQTAVSDASRSVNPVKNFELIGAYPNPFNPSTTIVYTLDKSIGVTLRIYNVLGNPVRTLVDHVQRPGLYRIVWDGKDDKGALLPGGVYFCRLSTSYGAQMKRVTLVY